MNKFHVFTNLAISFDGKISTKKREHIPASPADWKLMQQHRARAHAIVVGAGTLRTFKRAAKVTDRKLQLERIRKGLNIHPINVVLATQIDFSPSWPFFKSVDVQRVLVVPSKTPESKLKAFRPLAQVFKYDERKNMPRQLITFLKKLGCANALLEGGGGILFPWAQADLVDEWNVTISPKVIGGVDAPTMVEGEGFDAKHIKYYVLKTMKRSGSELFLQYVRK